MAAVTDGTAATGERDAHLRRAVDWHRHSRGPVSAAHRARALELARGSLRLWSIAGGVPEPGPAPAPTTPSITEVRLARIQLSAQVRAGCSALRADLAGSAAGLSRRASGAFEDVVRREMVRVADQLDEAVGGRLSDFGLPAGLPAGRPQPIRVEDLMPPRRRPTLENRLTALLGAGFGAGVSLTIGRLVAQVRPDWMPLGAVVCVLMGVAVTGWTVVVRRLLSERAAAERWAAEAVANLRPALEERLITRFLLAESALRDSPN